jgi:tetratricopeptide (TPR) repeat protein
MFAVHFFTSTAGGRMTTVQEQPRVAVKRLRIRGLARALAAAAGLAAPVMATTPIAGSNGRAWLRLDTPGFVVIGDAGEKRLQAIAADLERFREALSKMLPEGATSSAVPMVVIAFGRDKGLEPLAPLYQGKPVEIGGLMLDAPDIQYIALSAQGDRDDRLQIVFHEYAHTIIANDSARLPLWLNEGLAELYSTFTLRDRGREGVLGRVKLPYLELLKQKLPLPMADLMKVDRTSPLYNERERMSVFYAQSWALVHMLLMGDAERGPILTGFVRAVAGGRTPQDAWRQLSGGKESIENAFERYISRDRFNVFQFRFDTAVAAERARAAPVATSEVDAFLGDFLVRQRRFDDAAPYLERAIAQPQSRLAAAALKTARSATKAATPAIDPVEGRPEDWLTEYYVAAAALSAVRGDANPSDASELLAARTALEHVLRERPALANAWKMSAVRSLLENKDVGDARAAIKRARQLAPGRDDYALVHAETLARLGEFDLARSVLGPLMAPTSESALRDQARTQMTRILTLAALPPSLRESAAQGRSIPQIRQLRPGERRDEGLFERLECGIGLLAHIRLGDRVARFRARVSGDVELITYRKDDAGPLGCGVRTPPDRVLVTWRDDQSPGLEADGMLVALELLPR